MQQPLVSVSMVTYNHIKFIERAIESVVDQEIDFEMELVLGEDCSTDGTRTICEYYANKYPGIIRLLQSERNLGMTANGIRTFQNCTGKYIANLDGDDFWNSKLKLSKQIKFLEENPEYGMVYSNFQAVNAEGDEIDYYRVDQIRSQFSEGQIFFKILQTNFIPSCTVVYRRELIDFKGKDYHSLWYLQDFWYWLQIAMQSKIHYHDEILASWRLHEGGITASKAYSSNTIRPYYIYYNTLMTFNEIYKRKLNPTEKKLLYKRLLYLLKGSHGTPSMKAEIMKLLLKYFPGIKSSIELLKNYSKS